MDFHTICLLFCRTFPIYLLNQREGKISYVQPGGARDDESWLEVSPESLDRLLAARFGVSEGGKDNIPTELNAFLNRLSDMAGVVAGDEETEQQQDRQGLDLDPASLISSMQKLLGDDNHTEQPNGNANAAGDSDFSDDSDEEEIDDDEDPVIVDYMSRLDAEVGQGVQGREDLPDQARPLEVDSAVLANLLASYSAEVGLSGPTSSILNTLGINPGQKDG